MADERLLEPIQYYRSELASKCKDLSIELFDSLKNASGIDEEDNRKTCHELEAKKAQRDREESRKSAFTALGILSIIISIASGVFAVVYREEYKDYLAIFILVSAAFIALCVLSFRKRKKAKDISQKLSEKISQLFEKCKEQMAPLNALFDYSHFLDVAERTLPAFRFNKYTDDNFTRMMAENLSGPTPLSAMRDSDVTISSCLSGLVDGKMFTFLDYTKFYWGEKTYRGELLITWTEYDTDSEGHRVLVTRSQVLVAYLTKPFPMYRKDHCGLYYSQAAPKLRFTRYSAGLSNMSEKQIAGFVKKQSKKFEKQEKKALKMGKSWTQMADVEFEALFNAQSRDNDVEFRMMFTPYCIKNYMEMFKSKEGLSDSFTLIKDGCINLCDLDATLNKTARPQSYEVKTYSFDITKKLFISRCESFFRELYFTLAPFFMIPLYSHSLDANIKSDNGKTIYDAFDVESIASSFDDNVFRPQGTVTDIIRKSNCIGTYDFGCLYNITATSFYVVHRLEFVAEFGGDGRMHNVPVHWDEYIESSLQREMFVCYAGLKEADMYQRLSCIDTSGYIVSYKDGLLGFVSLSKNGTDTDVVKNIINSIIPARSVIEKNFE